MIRRRFRRALRLHHINGHLHVVSAIIDGCLNYRRWRWYHPRDWIPAIREPHPPHMGFFVNFRDNLD